MNHFIIYLFNCIHVVDSWLFYIIYYNFKFTENHDSQCIIIMFSESYLCLLSVLTAVSTDFTFDLL